ncbi:MAG TPA: CBS domain-containing protein [Actinomycetota bacterium]|nr:CBS domain-containing protein [Actinomycetota bacterium]
MRARDLAVPQPSVRADAPASEAAEKLASVDIRAIFVLGPAGELLGVVSDSSLLRELLPSYVEEDRALAAVVEEEPADELWLWLGGRTAADLLPEDQETEVRVDADATLIEVASVMVRARTPLVGVVDDGHLLGGITINRLLSHLLARG